MRKEVARSPLPQENRKQKQIPRRHLFLDFLPSAIVNTQFIQKLLSRTRTSQSYGHHTQRKLFNMMLLVLLLLILLAGTAIAHDDICHACPFHDDGASQDQKRLLEAVNKIASNTQPKAPTPQESDFTKAPWYVQMAVVLTWLRIFWARISTLWDRLMAKWAPYDNRPWGGCSWPPKLVLPIDRMLQPFRMGINQEKLQAELVAEKDLHAPSVERATQAEALLGEKDRQLKEKEAKLSSLQAQLEDESKKVDGLNTNLEDKSSQITTLKADLRDA